MFPYQPAPSDGPQPGPQAASQAPDPEELLQSMLQLATLYHQVESDQGDRLKIEKATTLIQQILADHQAQHDQLLGGNQAALRRVVGS